jgi:hypothetical protein
MDQVAEFLKHADECLVMAAKTRNPGERAQLENLARHWKLLAAERASLPQPVLPKPNDGGSNP